MYKEFFFLVSGAFEMDQANDPGKEVIAYKAIAALLERASTMLKGKIRNYSKMVRERGRMYLSHVMNFYTEERWITFEEEGEEVTEAINGSELISPAKLIVVSGSTMPISKVQEREEALALFQMGAIDLEELLKKIEWPDYKKVKARMESGPLGVFMQKLVALGLPEEFAEYFMQIAQMDDKEFQSKMEKGDLPTVPSLIQNYIENGGQLEDKETPMEEADLELKLAQIEKSRADTALVKAKIDTETVGQDTSRAGMGFDEKKLRLEEATTINDINQSIEQIRIQVEQLKVETALNAGKIVLDKEKADKDRVVAEKTAAAKPPPAKPKAPKKAPTKSSKKKTQGPYRERGLKSNNKK
jgi:hypothetical protein